MDIVSRFATYNIQFPFLGLEEKLNDRFKGAVIETHIGDRRIIQFHLGFNYNRELFFVEVEVAPPGRDPLPHYKEVLNVYSGSYPEGLAAAESEVSHWVSSKMKKGPTEAAYEIRHPEPTLVEKLTDKYKGNIISFSIKDSKQTFEIVKFQIDSNDSVIGLRDIDVILKILSGPNVNLLTAINIGQVDYDDDKNAESVVGDWFAKYGVPPWEREGSKRTAQYLVHLPWSEFFKEYYSYSMRDPDAKIFVYDLKTKRFLTANIQDAHQSLRMQLSSPGSSSDVLRGYWLPGPEILAMYQWHSPYGGLREVPDEIYDDVASKLGIYAATKVVIE